MKDIVVGHTKHTISGLFKFRLAITIRLFPTDMAVTVHFDDQLRVGAVEIHDIREDRMLPSKADVMDLSVA